MRGWYRPADGKWIDIGVDRRYDHAAAASDNDDDFRGVLRHVDGRLALLPGCVAPEEGDEVIGIHDLGDVTGIDELDPNDASVALGWVRVNCAATVTSGPYLHAMSERDLRAGMDFVRSRGVDLARPEREGFKGAFSGNVYALDLDTGVQRYEEYAFDTARRLARVREVTYGGPSTTGP